MDKDFVTGVDSNAKKSPRRVAFIAKAEYFETPGVKGRMMKAFFTAIGAIPVRRGDHRAVVPGGRRPAGLLHAVTGRKAA